MNVIRKTETLNKFLELIPKNYFGKTPQIGMIQYYYTSLYNKLVMWQKYGCKTFNLSPDLVDAFNQTDVNLNSSPTDFKYPFGCFMVESESALFQVKVNETEYTDIYNILFIDKETAESFTPVGEVAEVEWDVSINALSPGYLIEGIDTGMDYIWLNIKNSDLIRDMFENPSLQRGGVKITKTETQCIANIFYNTIMYLNDPTRNVKETESIRSKKIAGKGGKKDKRRMEYIYLTPPKNYQASNSAEHRTLDCRFRVRGHWTNQPYGEKNQLRRKQWIMPYWKGPEVSELINKPYKLT